jgi:hypothetical protein
MCAGCLRQPQPEGAAHPQLVHPSLMDWTYRRHPLHTTGLRSSCLDNLKGLCRKKLEMTSMR